MSQHGQATVGDTVKVHYRGILEDGSEFDSTLDRDPLTLTIGDGRYIQAFEDALLGMAEGDNKTVTIAASEAFGPHRKELVQEVDRSLIPPDMELEVAGSLLVSGPDGQPLRLTIRALSEDTVTLDANHPLAGEDLTFDLEVIEIL